MLKSHSLNGTKVMLLAIAAGSIFVLAAKAQSVTPAGQSPAAPPPTTIPTGQASAPGSQAAAPARRVAATSAPTRPVPNGLSRRAQMYYEGYWGVDELKVKYTESGEIIRFSWRVRDPLKAAPLNDKKVEPSLIDPQAGVKLAVPQMEKVGQLRQSSTPIAGMRYWMAFSNSGRRVRPGAHVSVEIGQFRAINLIVE